MTVDESWNRGDNGVEQELKEIMTLILDKIGNMESAQNAIQSNMSTMQSDLKEVKQQARTTDLRFENTVEPRLQLILENQSTVVAAKNKITELSAKLDDVVSDVSVIKEVVTRHSGEIDRLKKHA